MEKHLDIKEGQISNSKTAKNFFWPFPFSFPMYDPYNTGPISQPILSPAGGIVMPRRNPYIPRRTNPMLNPYNAQYRINSWPVTQPMMRSPFGMPGRVPMGQFGRPARGPLNGPPGSPRAVPPAGGFNTVPLYPPPGRYDDPPPRSSWQTTGGWGAYGGTYGQMRA